MVIGLASMTVALSILLFIRYFDDYLPKEEAIYRLPLLYAEATVLAIIGFVMVVYEFITSFKQARK